MSDPSLAMQGAITTALSGSSALAAAAGGVARVFDSVPDGAPYPYVRVGEDQALPIDTDCGKAWEFFATLHIFADPIGNVGARPVAKRMAGPIQAELLALEDAVMGAFKIDDVSSQGSRFFMEADGVVAHGVVTVRFLITENA